MSDDPIDHPKHYTQGKIEAIDHIEDVIAGYKDCDPASAFLVGQVIKYLCRAPFKDTKESILKAQ